MALDNGARSRSCSTCDHWANRRAMPEDPRVVVGDCTAIIFPFPIQFIPGKGVSQFPGGVQVVTLAQSYCTHFWKPRLSILAERSALSVAATVKDVKEPA